MPGRLARTEQEGKNKHLFFFLLESEVEQWVNAEENLATLRPPATLGLCHPHNLGPVYTSSSPSSASLQVLLPETDTISSGFRISAKKVNWTHCGSVNAKQSTNGMAGGRTTFNVLLSSNGGVTIIV